MAYLDSNFGKLGSPSPGRRYYEALCMRSINQAIGRAIRHEKDYAVVFLLDQRFQRVSIQDQLSKWIKPSIRKAVGDKENQNFNFIIDQAREFLENNQKPK